MQEPSTARPQTEPDDADRLLLELASALLADHFFDPDNEAAYRKVQPSGRAASRAAPPVPGPPLAEDMLEAGGNELKWRLDALGHRNGFRLSMRHPVFAAIVEGTWQFQREALRQGRVIERSGDPGQAAEAAEALLAAFTDAEPSQEELDDLLAALSEVAGTPSGGEQPARPFDENAQEPPPATDAERNRARSVVERLAGHAGRELRVQDRTWLETMPQTLPAFTDLLVEALSAKPRDEGRVAACLDLVTRQLEFVRYRLDRGWDWASRMLSDYQQRLVALGKAGTLEQADWFAMAAALTQARVPVSGGVQLALADAGLRGDANPAPPDDLLAALRGLSDELAGMVGSPFEVIEALNAAGAVMPATLRSFMATELALSPHAVLREAVPLMLLDGESDVRRAAGAAMAQTAGPDTVSPDWLRRAVTVRNWVPQADRAELDRAIHKARAAGVPIATWPVGPGDAARGSPGDVAFHASMVDGSGAQSILAVSRSGRKGLIAGLLLKHGAGVQDAWLDEAAPRGDINKMLRGVKAEVPFDEVDRGYVDAAVQHAIATGLANGAVPTERLLLIAECLEGAAWKDRRLDVAAEADRLFAGLGAAERRPPAVAAALRRGADWMPRQPIAASWFEDGPNVRRAIAGRPRTDLAGATRLVLGEILPASRMAWAERFLLMAMWCQAAASGSHRAWAADFVIVAHALAGATPLEAIPIMGSIAAQTVMAARNNGW